MTRERSRCSKHPSQPLVGICGSCLRERLGALTSFDDKKFHNSSRVASQPSSAGQLTRNGFVEEESGQSSLSLRKKNYYGIHGSSNSETPGNAHRTMRRSKSFCGEDRYVTSVNEVTFLGALPEIGRPFPNRKTLSTLFNLDDGEAGETKAIHLVDIREPSAHNLAYVATEYGGENGHLCNPSVNATPNVAQTRKNGEQTNSEVSGERFEMLPRMPEGNPHLFWLTSLFRKRMISRSRHKCLGNTDKHRKEEKAMPNSMGESKLSSWAPEDRNGTEMAWKIPHDAISNITELGEERNHTRSITRPSPKSRDAGDIVLPSKPKDSTKQGLSSITVDQKETVSMNLIPTNHGMHRDVATQTTPVRVAVKGTIPTNSDQPARAVSWSNVWSKAFTNPMWAFKQKHRRQENYFDDQANNPVGSSSILGSSIKDQSTLHINGSALPRDHGLWNAYYSPAVDRPLKYKPKRKDHEIFDRSRTVSVSPCNMQDNGLLRFYLTPLRTRNRARPKSGHNLWI
eukprot:c22234_g1_i1 orf=686-2224(+)